MTVNKVMTQEAKHGGATALQTYLMSLTYLRQEARREGLHVVAGIMWEAGVAIEVWLDSGNAPAHNPDVLNSPLCHSLDFLLKWLALPPAGRRRVAHDIARGCGSHPGH